MHATQLTGRFSENLHLLELPAACNHLTLQLLGTCSPVRIQIMRVVNFFGDAACSELVN